MFKAVLLSLFFFTFPLLAQSPIHEFNFDGTLANQNRSATFYGNAKFTKDRFGTKNKAIFLKDESLIANISNLPQHNSPRTISIWIKFNDINDSNYIWSYGTAANNTFCGLIHQGTPIKESSVCVASWGKMNDFVTTVSLEKEVWYNYTYVYNGKTGSLYRNGSLIATFNEPFRNTLGSIFKIGNINSIVSINAVIDDIKIYNIALSSEEIRHQYKLQSPPIRIENLKIAIKKGNVTHAIVCNH